MAAIQKMQCLRTNVPGNWALPRQRPFLFLVGGGLPNRLGNRVQAGEIAGSAGKFGHVSANPEPALHKRSLGGEYTLGHRGCGSPVGGDRQIRGLAGEAGFCDSGLSVFDDYEIPDVAVG